MSVVGIDIGGTFTDLVGLQDGAIVTAKTLTIPSDPTVGAATALRLAGCDVTAVGELLHGSTIAINTVLERSGAATALVTTEGFRDVYALGRGNRPDAFNLDFHRPRPLVPRDRTFEAPERMNAAGEVLIPLDVPALEALAHHLNGLGIEAIAVCFLHAYANPAHEIVAGETLRRLCPKAFVTTSHEILREFREYERTSTTALNAYVGPRVSTYLARFETFARGANFGGQIAIMRSNGGTMSIAEARRQPVAMMESGPVAGMIGAAHLARLLGLDQVIGFDMGGTTAKTALITGGVLPIEEGYVIGDAFTGQPMQLPVVDIVEVGAGGGSIAWVDATGGLHVGPVSAGADPGPVCYGRGGERPTVTDADLLLGRLNGERFLGGGMTLDRAGAAAALATLGEQLGLDAMTAAYGIAAIADGAMSLAVRAVSVNRGIDPRDTAMIAFGGAGPLHAAAIAREISIPKVIVPKLPGNFSALGMLMAAWRQDFVRTLIGELDRLRLSDAARAFADLRAAGTAALARDGYAGGELGHEGLEGGGLDRIPFTSEHLESWPGLSRPSTSSLKSRRNKDVDARDERGHDADEDDWPSSRSGLAAKACAPATFAFAADLRYRGQEHTIPIPVECPEDLAGDTAVTRQNFNAQHDRRYGHAAPDQGIEIVNLRLVVTVPRQDDAIGAWPATPWVAAGAGQGGTGVAGRRLVVCDDPARPLEAGIFWRDELPAGTRIRGPAVIEEANSTTFVPEGAEAAIDGFGNIEITLGGG